MHLLLVLGVILTAGCSEPVELVWQEDDGFRWASLDPGTGDAGFRQLSPSRTGIKDAHELSEEDIAGNRHYLNGSGAAAADVDGDGHVDLYFGRLKGSNRLYRNLGNFRFEDITEAAGLAHEDYETTSVVFADIDQDRDPDLLVGSLHRGVTVYLNDGRGGFQPNPTAGLAATAEKGTYTLALADVDGDGTLDLYVTNYREWSINDLEDVLELTWENTVQEIQTGDSPEYRLRPPFDDFYTIVQREGLPPERREVGEPDQLFLGDGKGGFAEVTSPERWFRDADGEPWGPPRDWGLSAKFQDLNQDGWLDLYVANDFWTPDRVWINRGGFFQAIDPLAIRNQSFSSMTVDFSDINRDGHVDIYVTEMLSPLHEERARHYKPTGPYPYQRFRIEGRPSYNRNSLFTNRGDGTYAEIAYFSGVEGTGWSWTTRFLDVDLDGFEDLLVANGFSFDLQDMDAQMSMHREMATGVRASQAQLTGYPPLHQVNIAFRNNGDRTFTDRSQAWGFQEEDISQAMVTGDLDHDGDLDLVINRLNDPPAIYENLSGGPRIAVRLLGRPPNTAAVGSRIRLEGGPTVQESQVVAGGDYLSGSDPLTVFSAAEGADHTLVVSWPDGGETRIERVGENRIYAIPQPEARMGSRESITVQARTLEGGPAFQDISDRLQHIHHEEEFGDWRLQPLLTVGVSRQGPGVSWIDHDGDGDDDLFVATGRGGRLGVYENRNDGRFAPVTLGPASDTAMGDQTTLLGWRDVSGTTLVVGQANLEYGNVGAAAAIRYSLSGEVRIQDSIPDNLSTTGPMAAADYDGDGDVDLFVGGRFVPAQYPVPATSRLFRNEMGRFQLDEENAGVLRQTGLVTGAVFTDFDGDGDPDLLLSLEWGSLRLFRNEGGRYQDVTEQVGLEPYDGWWGGVATGDFNEDGLPDIIGTNWGTNSPYRIHPRHPPRMYYGDFNRDRRVDIIEAYWNDASNAYVPRRQLSDYGSISGFLGRTLRTHNQFANTTVAEIFGTAAGTPSFLEITTLEPTVFINESGRFTPHRLPPESAWTNGFAAVVADYDNDGHEDVFISQNLFYVREDLPRLDAGRGLWLKGDGEGGFSAIPGQVSGVRVYGEQRGAAAGDFDGDARVDLVVTQNSGPTRLFRNRSPRAGIRIEMEGPEGNRQGIGSSVRVVYAGGTRGPRREIQAGSGYWSQNSAVPILGTNPGRTPVAVEVNWFDGTKARVPLEEGRRSLRIPHPSAGRQGR